MYVYNNLLFVIDLHDVLELIVMSRRVLKLVSCGEEKPFPLTKVLAAACSFLVVVLHYYSFRCNIIVQHHHHEIEDSL